MTQTVHWTEKNTDAFVNRLSFDFITQLAKKMELLPLRQSTLAQRLGLTEGRVSQIFNNPGNLTLSRMTEYARALGMKIAIVAYDDRDPGNERGPITSEIFNICWERAGKPLDFWAVRAMGSPRVAVNNEAVLEKQDGNYKYTSVTSMNIDRKSGISGSVIVTGAESEFAVNNSSMLQPNAF